MVRQLLFVYLGLFACLGLYGQDIHYSQFMNTPLHVSPGLTGVFQGNTRVGATYRSQWTDVPVPYRTFSAYVDHKFYCGREQPGFWSVGLALNHDRAGDSRLTWANAGGYVSYTQPLSDRTLLTGGATLGLGQRSFDTENLRSDRQFDGRGGYDPSIGLGEDFNRTSLIFLDFGLGANLRLQTRQHDQAQRRNYRRPKVGKRSRLDVGFGLHHINRPNMSFVDDETVNLPMRLAIYGDGLLEIAKKLDLRAGVQLQFQSVYREYLGTLGLKVYLDQNRGKEFALAGAMGLRMNEFTDAWFPMLEFHFREQLRVSISYDVNVSDFQVATDNNGGIEIGIRYLFKKICPVPNVKYCPPFI